MQQHQQVHRAHSAENKRGIMHFSTCKGIRDQDQEDESKRLRKDEIKQYYWGWPQRLPGIFYCAAAAARAAWRAASSASFFFRATHCRHQDV